MEMKTVKLWDVVYVILYNTGNGQVDTQAVIEELQDTDDFKLNDRQEEKLIDLIEELHQVIDDETDGWEDEGISFDNGEYEADYIITKYKLDGDLPVITYDPITGRSLLNTDMTTYELK